MSKEYVVLVAEGCPHCGSMIEKAKKKYGKVTVLDVTKQDRATDLAMKLNVRAVPTLVAVEDEKVCVLNDSGRKERCES